MVKKYLIDTENEGKVEISFPHDKRVFQVYTTDDNDVINLLTVNAKTPKEGLENINETAEKIKGLCKSLMPTIQGTAIFEVETRQTIDYLYNGVEMGDANPNLAVSQSVPDDFSLSIVGGNYTFASSGLEETGPFVGPNLLVGGLYNFQSLVDNDVIVKNTTVLNDNDGYLYLIQD